MSLKYMMMKPVINDHIVQMIRQLIVRMMFEHVQVIQLHQLVIVNNVQYDDVFHVKHSDVEMDL